MAQSTHNPARREAVLWALGQLENLMGPDWLERYFAHTGHVPTKVSLGCAHVAATGNLQQEETSIRTILQAGRNSGDPAAAGTVTAVVSLCIADGFALRDVLGAHLEVS